MKEYPAEWIAVLRSGKYKQGTCALRRCDMFCCLGVRCDIENSTKWVENAGEYKWDGEGGYLPMELRKKDGFKSENGYIPFVCRDHTHTSLAYLNDDGFTFDQIADLIECFWEVI